MSKNKASSYIRAVHLATKAPDVDLYVNDQLAASNLKYREFTKYLELPSGIYNIKLYETGDTKTPVLDVDANLTPNSIVTAAVYSKDRNLNVSLIEEEPIDEKSKYTAKVRIAHFMENTPPVDVIVKENGIKLVEDANFLDIGEYIELSPATYTFDMLLADTDISLLYVPNATLKAGNYYTLYVIGLLNDYHDPQMLIPLDGVSYIKTDN